MYFRLPDMILCNYPNISTKIRSLRDTSITTIVDVVHQLFTSLCFCSGAGQFLPGGVTKMHFIFDALKVEVETEFTDPFCTLQQPPFITERYSGI